MESLQQSLREGGPIATSGTHAGANDVSMERVVELAELHEVASLFLSRQQALEFPVAEGLLHRLRSRFERNARRSLVLSGQLAHLVGLASRSSLRVMAFKGPMLATVAYENVALREFSDLDILVSPQDLPRAKQLLLNEGFMLRRPLTALQERWLLESQCEYEFLRSDGVAVDLHWGFTPRYFPYPVDFEQLWRRRRTVNLGPVAVSTIGNEDLVGVLCAHGAKSGWSKLKWVIDVAHFVKRHPDLDWDLVQREAGIAGTARMVHVGIQLAGDMFGSPVPVSSNEASEKRRSRELAVGLKARLLSGPPRDLSPLQMARLQVRLRERLRQRVSVAARVAFLPNHFDAAAVPVPRQLSFVQYCVRPVRLAVTSLAKQGRRI